MAAAAINADLHSHSTASDGLLEPQALARRIHGGGVTLWSLTDHDTLAGQVCAAEEATRLGMGFVSGIEITAMLQGRPVHIVGLDFALDSAALAAVVSHNTRAREERSLEIADRLEKHGFSGVLEGARALAGDTAGIGRPHFARYLHSSGQISTMREAYEHYLGEGQPCNAEADWVDSGQAITSVTGAGGIAVLAHPLVYRLRNAALLRMVHAFAEQGGEALEVVSGSRQQSQQTWQLTQMAVAAGLLGSRGSDFHGGPDEVNEPGVLAALPPQLTPVWQRFS